MLFITNSIVFPQAIQRKRTREHAERVIQAANEKEEGQQAPPVTVLPAPKPAVMNVDVQMVLSGKDLKTFAEAKSNAVNRVIDGSPLWLYIKFNGKLGDYVFTTIDTEEPGKLKYLLYAEIGPQGDVTAPYQNLLQFSKEELAANELKISLAPGMFGRNSSISLFLTSTAALKPGVWNNELRLANAPGFPRSPDAHLAKYAITLNLSEGPAKYRKSSDEYDSIILRGTSDVTKMPVPGTFFSEPVKSQILAKLSAEGITPVKLYFSGDDWTVFTTGSFFTMKKSRKTFATYTYQKGANCLYGVAEVLQTYDSFNSKFGESTINLTNGLPATCSALNG